MIRLYLARLFSAAALAAALCVAPSFAAEPWTDAEIARRGIEAAGPQGWLFVHVDVTALEPKSFREMLAAIGEQAPFQEAMIDRIEPQLKMVRGLLDSAGIEEVVGGEGGPGNSGPVLVVRRRADGNDNSFRTLIGPMQLRFEKLEGEVITLRQEARPGQVQEAGDPAVDPKELEQAFASVKGSPIRLVSMKTPVWQHAFSDLEQASRAEEAGEAVRSLVADAKWLAIGVDLNRKGRLEIRVQTQDEATAEALRGKVVAGLDAALADQEMQEFLAKYGISQATAGKAFELLEPHREEIELVLVRSLDEPEVGQTIQQAVPGVQKAAARKTQLMLRGNDLKQIALALHNFHDVYKHLPAGPAQKLPPGSKEGKGLSWRVALLPFMEEQELYERFRLDEPWDSEHNRKLIAEMPEVYDAGIPAVPAGKTVYVLPIYEGAATTTETAPGFRDYSDGLSNTFLVLEAAPEQAVVWTQPDDLEIDLDRFAELVGEKDEKVFRVVFGDGSVQELPKSLDKETVRRLIQHADGEIVDRSAF